MEERSRFNYCSIAANVTQCCFIIPRLNECKGSGSLFLSLLLTRKHAGTKLTFMLKGAVNVVVGKDQEKRMLDITTNAIDKGQNVTDSITVVADKAPAGSLRHVEAKTSPQICQI